VGGRCLNPHPFAICGFVQLWISTQEPMKSSDPAWYQLQRSLNRISSPFKAQRPHPAQTQAVHCVFCKSKLPVEAPTAFISFPSACDMTNVRSAALCKYSSHKNKGPINFVSQVLITDSPRKFFECLYNSSNSDPLFAKPCVYALCTQQPCYSCQRMEHKGFRKDRRVLTDYKPCGLHKPTKCVLRNIPAHYKTYFTMMISSWKG
jgi:hypothetical protein